MIQAQITNRHTRACTHTHTHTLLRTLPGVIESKSGQLCSAHSSHNNFHLICLAQSLRSAGHSFFHLHIQQGRRAGPFSGRMEVGAAYVVFKFSLEPRCEHKQYGPHNKNCAEPVTADIKLHFPLRNEVSLCAAE